MYHQVLLCSRSTQSHAQLAKFHIHVNLFAQQLPFLNVVLPRVANNAHLPTIKHRGCVRNSETFKHTRSPVL
ncbi:hypothetical protein RB195_005101 [Necator americanus]|uniref:Uncharacterized protein n=1 Tax=Necator americanus TaxID=51031 RepID=A0ABR1BQ13_NECAM